MNVGSYLAELKNQLFKRFQIIRRRIERRPDAFPGLEYESFVTRLSVLEKIEVSLLMAHWREAVDNGSFSGDQPIMQYIHRLHNALFFGTEDLTRSEILYFNPTDIKCLHSLFIAGRDVLQSLQGEVTAE